MGWELRLLCDLNSKAAAGGKAGIWWLLGLPWMPHTVLSCMRCLHFEAASSMEPDYAAESDDINCILPKGLEIVGILVIFEDDFDIAIKAGRIAFEMLRSLGTPSLMERELAVATCVVGADICYNLYLCGRETLEAYDNVQQVMTHGKKIWDETTLLRCQMTFDIPLFVSPPDDAKRYKEQLEKGVNDIIHELMSSKLVLLVKLHPPGSGGNPVTTVIRPNQPSYKNGERSNLDLTLAPSQGDNMAHLKAFEKNENIISKSSGAQVPFPVTFTCFREQLFSNGKVFAPVVQCMQVLESTALYTVRFSTDVLCFASCYSSPQESATSLVVPALCSQLKAMERKAVKDPFKPVKLFSYHFCPPTLLHPVTVVYDLNFGETEVKLVERRKVIHHRLGLPLDRPMLRVANALKFDNINSVLSRSSGVKRLMDVHEGIAGSGVVGGQTSLIQGSYEYYHYLQDHIDDSGWGCAYRSLQTIVSWFRLQQYTDLPVPTHREIQETLVSIGDKDPAFINSQEWIGAIELGFVLDKLLGVTCKILNVRSGAEMPEKCRELATHFTTQGTPVMIGGGVLAYTLLGIDYNAFTGESSFLILDPHYTGREDLKSIHAGGWCGWKKAVSNTGQEFFLRNKFYNLLLPQRPNTV